MTKENKKFDDGLRAIMGDADFDKATNPRERRAPNGQYLQVPVVWQGVWSEADAEIPWRAIGICP